jgi:hypothetical protein
MKLLIQFALLFCAMPFAVASESQTLLLAQPILAHGGTVHWESGDPKSADIDFKIVDVPFLDWSHQGHPAYRGIAQPNQILTNAPRDVRLPESNLLALYGITIGYDFSTGDVWLRLDSARAVDGWRATIDDAAYAALECIRIVANRYRDHPKLHISAPKGEESKWSDIEKRFHEHDLTKPFAKA